MNIEKIIDDKLLSDEQGKPKRERSGKYSPSSFGRCFRLQYWNRKDEPVTNPPDLEGLKRMEQGKALHKWVQGHFPHKVCEITIERDHFKGRADLVGDDIIFDIKGATAYAYRRFWNIPIKKVLVDKENFWLQVAWYALELKKSRTSLVPWVYGTYTRFEHVVFTETLRGKVEEEVKTLIDIWERDWLPPPKPRAYGGNDCQYCSWEKKCKLTEGGK